MRTRSSLMNRLRGVAPLMSVMARPVPELSAALRRASNKLARSTRDRSSDPDIAPQHNPALGAPPGRGVLEVKEGVPLGPLAAPRSVGVKLGLGFWCVEREVY